MSCLNFGIFGRDGVRLEDAVSIKFPASSLMIIPVADLDDLCAASKFNFGNPTFGTDQESFEEVSLAWKALA